MNWKGAISKQKLQENMARQIFWKTTISYPLIRTCRYAYQWVRNVRFSENLLFCFLATSVLRFAIFPDHRRLIGKINGEKPPTNYLPKKFRHRYLIRFLKTLPDCWLTFSFFLTVTYVSSSVIYILLLFKSINYIFSSSKNIFYRKSDLIRKMIYYVMSIVWYLSVWEGV